MSSVSDSSLVEQKIELDQLLIAEIDRLVINLEDQYGLHLHLKLVLEKELSLKADCEISTLESIQQRKIEIASKLYDLEDKRKKIVQNIFELKKIEATDPQETSLKKLVGYLSQDYAKKLMDLHAKLTEILAEIQTNTYKTVTISKARLISLRDTTDQLDKWMTHHTLYSKLGGLKNTAQSRFLNRYI